MNSDDKPFKSLRIAGIGEVLWDVFPNGEYFGGAPANFACHCQFLGAEACMISAVGRDERGRKAVQFLDKIGISTREISILENYPTGIVEVKLDKKGVPVYDIKENVAWDHIPFNESMEDLASTLDAVCFGTLSQRHAASRTSIQRFLKATRNNCLKVFDVNLRQQYYQAETIRESLEVADILKLNDEELPVVLTLLGLDTEVSGSSIEKSMALIRDVFKLELVVLTCGPKGAWMLSRDELSFFSPPKVVVVSTVGAGDSFTAATVMGYLHQKPLERINREANDLAAHVCTRRGAVL